MKNIVNRILQERKKNINKGLHKDHEIGQIVLAASNTIYGMTGIQAVTQEESDKMKEKIKDVDVEKVVRIWDSYII